MAVIMKFLLVARNVLLAVTGVLHIAIIAHRIVHIVTVEVLVAEVLVAEVLVAEVLVAEVQQLNAQIAKEPAV